MRFTGFVNGAVALVLAALMGVDALLFPETAEVFGEAAVLTAAVGGLVMIATANARAVFSRLYGFLVTTTVWLTASMAGALPLWLWGMGGVDATFEAVSGITTTGSTVLSGLDHAPRGVLFWRAVLQYTGGVGFVVAAMALLPVLRVGGMQLYRTESSDKDDSEFGSAAHFAGMTLLVYLGLTAACGLAYQLGGMGFFDAVTHAMTTLSTGGYANYDASFGHFQSGFLQWSATIFMLAGALPFAWYIRMMGRGQGTGRLRSEQVTAMLWSLGIVITALTLWLSLTQLMNPLVALRLVAFNVVSVVTTTGFASTDYLQWGPVAVVAFFLLTPVGGCTGSTAGGAKAMRWIIALRSIRARINAITTPHAITPLRYNGRTVGDDVLSGVMAFLFFYFGTAAAVAAGLSLMEIDALTAVSGALTAVANVGPGVGPVIGPAGNFASLEDPAKLLLAFGMYAGRLEMMTLFVLLLPSFWREI